eukprot:SAG22_NODE_69_length_22779_cov_71.088139_14_plen_172_part_00
MARDAGGAAAVRVVLPQLASLEIIIARTLTLSLSVTVVHVASIDEAEGDERAKSAFEGFLIAAFIITFCAGSMCAITMPAYCRDRKRAAAERRQQLLSQQARDRQIQEDRQREQVRANAASLFGPPRGGGGGGGGDDDLPPIQVDAVPITHSSQHMESTTVVDVVRVGASS